MDKVEVLILRNLRFFNEEYLRKVVPFIKPDYFEDPTQKMVFEETLSFVQEYNQPPTKEVLCIEVEKRDDINDTSFAEATKFISYLEDVPTDFDWLVDTTEKWCRDRAILSCIDGVHCLQMGPVKERARCYPNHPRSGFSSDVDSDTVGHDLLDYDLMYESY